MRTGAGGGTGPIVVTGDGVSARDAQGSVTAREHCPCGPAVTPGTDGPSPADSTPPV